MADKNHLDILSQGVGAWNEWRRLCPQIRPNLSAAQLPRQKLRSIDFSDVDLTVADLREADLSWARLCEAHLGGAALVGANLVGTDLTGAYLDITHLQDADLTRAVLNHTLIANCELRGARGLDKCLHLGPSYIDYQTLTRSGQLPIAFLRGCGLPDALIDYLPSLVGVAFQPFSCFISYSSKDKVFANRLAERLRARGVSVWYAPKKIKAGEHLHEQIDRAIQFHDRLLLVLSKTSMKSEWVKLEIRKVLEREQTENRRVLFPIRLVPMGEIRRREWVEGKLGKDLIEEICKHHIPDFSNWKNHGAFQEAFDRLLKDLE